MKIKSTPSGAVVAAVALSLSGLVSLASAETVTFRGAVLSDSEYNALGVSGYGQNTFIGQTASESFTFNRANGVTVTSPGYYTYTYGGLNYNIPGPVAAVSLTVGGHTIYAATPAADWSEVWNSSPAYYGDGQPIAGYGQQSAEASQDIGNWDNEQTVHGYASLAGPNVPQFGSGVGAGRGEFSSTNSNYHTGAQTMVYLEFAPTLVSVPETSTWAMMLLGFGFLCFGGYRRGEAIAGSIE